MIGTDHGSRPASNAGRPQPNAMVAVDSRMTTPLTARPAPSPRLGRVLLVAPQPFFELRGTPLNVLHMVRTLSGAGYEVHLVTYGLGEPVRVPGLVHHRGLMPPGIREIPIGFSRRKVLLDVLLAPLVWRLLLSTRFDVAHAVEEAVFFTLPMARLRGVPVIYDLDSSISHQLEYMGVVRRPWLLDRIRDMERAAIRRSALALTVCRSLSETVREAAPLVPIAQVEDFPLDEAVRPAQPAKVRRLREEFGLVGSPVVVYTGNLERYQGVDLLLAALPLMAARCPSARVVIVGGEQHQIANARAALAGSAEGAIVHFAGKRPASEMAEFMGMADVLVSPRSEGFNTPLKIYSYMSAGVPIVATDRLTHTQVLDEQCAVLCEPTPDGLADALCRVLADPAAYASLGVTARERVRNQYSRAAFERKLLAAYDLVIGRQPGPAGSGV